MTGESVNEIQEMKFDDSVMEFFRGKRVLVTGASGTIGEELLKQLTVLNVPGVFAVDRDESAIFFLRERYDPSVVDALPCDICDFPHVERIMQGIDIVFHCAGYKHVTLGEISPYPCLQTNVIGLQNVIDAALKAGVQKFIFASSDKAVNPTNVMGTTKLLGERLVTAANNQKSSRPTILSSVRFGNVVGSSGSVLCVFKQQIAEGRNLTLTDTQMTRFFMTIPAAAQLLIRSAVLARGGEVFVSKMPVFRIEDLARALIEELAVGKNIEVEVIGKKAGEKLYEELLTDEEASRSLNFDNFIVIKPAFPIVGKIEYQYYGDSGEPVNKAYISAAEPPWPIEKIRDFLVKNVLV